jgi:putative endonuclease
MAASVYVLRSQQRGQLYLGWTTDLQRRLCEHHEGQSDATGNTRPHEWIDEEAYAHRAEAVAREQSLKKHAKVWKQVKRRLAKRLATASARAQEVGG